MRRGLFLVAAIVVCLASSIVNADIIGTYVDANLSNTTPVSAITETDSDTDNLWRHRIYAGPMDGTLFGSQAVAENSPTLTTTVSGLAEGVYDVYVLFWDKTGSSDVQNNRWAVEAGIGNGALSIYSEYNSTLTGITADADKQQYQGYLGQATITNGTLAVTIDDGVGANFNRAWYDGVSYDFVRAVPEPSAFVVMFTGLLGLLAYAWRKRK
jgi:hypothetical protein